MSVVRRMSPADRREHLVDRALGLFAAQPEDEVGLEDLAEAAGVTRNLLYHYFASRGELQRAAVGEAIARVGQRFVDDPAVPLAAKLPGNIALWLDGVEHGDPSVLLILRARTSNDREVAALVAQSRVELCRAIAGNHLGDADPAPQVLAVLDGYLTLAEQLIVGWRAGDLTRAEVERVLADVLPVLVASISRGA